MGVRSVWILLVVMFVLLGFCLMGIVLSSVRMDLYLRLWVILVLVLLVKRNVGHARSNHRSAQAAKTPSISISNHV